MTDGETRNGQEPDDTGDPLTLVSELEESPTTGFLGRLRATVERRRLGSTTMELGWSGFLLVAFEYLAVLFAALNPAPRKEGPRERP